MPHFPDRICLGRLTIVLILASPLLVPTDSRGETGTGRATAESASAQWPFAEELLRPTRQFPHDRVRVEIVEGVPDADTWDFDMHGPRRVIDTDFFAMKNLPRRYNPQGLIDDRELPLLLHLSSRVELPAGAYEFIVRSLDATRLYVDGNLVAETDFMSLRADAHQKYYDGLERGPNILSGAEGHQEQHIPVKLEGSSHEVSLYRRLGRKKTGPYVGELIVAVASVGGDFRILSPTGFLPYTDAGWLEFLTWERNHLSDVDQEYRHRLREADSPYWTRRHEAARTLPGSPDPAIDRTGPDHQSIDRFIEARLDTYGRAPQPVIDDLTFLRRVSLDTIGQIPSERVIESFLRRPAATRRQHIVDRLLDDPGWADHWVGYWQDALAENPGLTKPELNNTGPFRWFLHETFLDNKPFDRFVTELIMMEGSRCAGGPAGFGMASQNDVPMAAKAHIIGTAFLGIEMKCARCHDAPYHDVMQQDLFSIAAMLERKPLTVPGTSSLPPVADGTAERAVQVSLRPGSTVVPHWPFAEFTPGMRNVNAESDVSTWREQFLRDQADPREQLALFVTSPANGRFADVIVNRLWKRYLGRGLVEPVDDWEQADCSHPLLLEFLADELVTHGYDLKHVARLILNSKTYQREMTGGIAHEDTDPFSFTGPLRRRLSAEQIVDSLLVAVGKDLGCEELTMDRDGKRANSRFGHLGVPRRAWEMVAVSNERDRPALNLPAAQSVIDLLSVYGWRQQRQEPVSERANSPTALQQMLLAHGTAANRLVDLSDGTATTDLCLADQPLDVLVRRLFQRCLTRLPTAEEHALLAALLQDGYQTRIVAGPEAVHPRRIYRSGITWSNHFDPRSGVEAHRRQREVLQGDPPTARLAPDWRERAEDALWALINSPEFQFIP